MEKLYKLLTALEDNISKQQVAATTISKSNIGWHIEHTLLATNKIIESIKNSDPSNYKWRFNLPKLIVFTFNKIPRGRAKAPKVVNPKTYDEQTLLKHFETTRINIHQLASIHKDKYFEHPFFGNLKLQESIKFLELHTNHHLKIIYDILKSSKLM